MAINRTFFMILAVKLTMKIALLSIYIANNHFVLLWTVLLSLITIPYGISASFNKSEPSYESSHQQIMCSLSSTSKN